MHTPRSKKGDDTKTIARIRVTRWGIRNSECVRMGRLGGAAPRPSHVHLEDCHVTGVSITWRSECSCAGTASRLFTLSRPSTFKYFRSTRRFHPFVLIFLVPLSCSFSLLSCSFSLLSNYANFTSASHNIKPG
jgi:hypothetical protein